MPGLSVLIPLDGSKLSESAFALLPFLKTLGFDKASLISVWDAAWEDREAAGREKQLQEATAKGHAYLDAYLAQKADEVKALGLQAETIVRDGKAAEETLAIAEAGGIDLVLIATHGREGIARWRLGSVADKIVRNAPCPTVVIGPNVETDLAAYTLKRLLVPLDGSEMAESALPLASWIAGLTSCQIELVRVVSLAPVAYDPSLGVYPGDLLSAMEDAAKSYLSGVAERLAPAKTKASLLIGSGGEQILEYLKENTADLVIMASHGRSGLTRAALGSVADRVLHGPAPVLVFRPDEVTKSRLFETAKTAPA